MSNIGRLQISETPSNQEPHFNASVNRNPCVREIGGSLSLNGQIALSYLGLGYWPIPLILNENGSWKPAPRWRPFQCKPPTRQQVFGWWTKWPMAGIGLICGLQAGLVVCDIDPRNGGLDPKLSLPACRTPRGGVHYHFVAPTPIPDLSGPGLEWLADGHIARVPPTPGYTWFNSSLPPRSASYESIQLPPPVRSHRPLRPTVTISQRGNLCDILGQALGRQIRPGTTIRCFCHSDKNPSLGIYPDHAYCFSQNRLFRPRQVLEGLRVANLVHIDGEKSPYEVNAHDGPLRSIAPMGLLLAEEKARLVGALKELGLVDKAKEVEMCGQWVTREKPRLIKTRTCEDCGTTFPVRSRCHSRFCPECAVAHAKDAMSGKEAVFENARCAIARLPLPSLAENSSTAFSRAKKEVSETLRRLLGRKSGPACHKILAGCRNGEFRWGLVVLATEGDALRLKDGWPYGTATLLKELTPHEALALYLEVVAKPPEWQTARDLATLDTMLYRQRLQGSHGEAHGNSSANKAKPKPPETARRCPLCGSSNLSRPVYRDPTGVHWVNGVAIWSPSSSDPPPP